MRMGLSRLDKPDARRIAPVCQYPGRVLTGSQARRSWRELSRSGRRPGVPRMIGGLAFDPVSVDLASPGPRRGALRLDELLVPLEVAFDPTLEESEIGTDRLDDAFGIGVHLEGDAGSVGPELFEQDGTGILG